MHVCVHAFATIRVVKNHWKTDPTNQNRTKKSIPASFSLSAVGIGFNFLNKSVFQPVSVPRIHTMRTSQIYFFMNLLTFCKPTLMLSNPFNLVSSSHSHFLQISSITLPHSSSNISFIWNSNPSHWNFAFPPPLHASSHHSSLEPPPPPIFYFFSNFRSINNLMRERVISNRDRTWQELVLRKRENAVGGATIFLVLTFNIYNMLKIQSHMIEANSQSNGPGPLHWCPFLFMFILY